ncbi:unnamed protein product [Caenorhabditis sp. 36 PRJEB53466]|nr:unnamed protein product [Caenorhabditis sp. 36 PRJEB53466]
MKSLLLVIGIICFYANVESKISVSKRMKGPVRSPFIPKLIVEEVNNDRIAFAQTHKTEKMPSVIWDDELAQKAERMPQDCSALKPGPDYRVYPDYAGAVSNGGDVMRALEASIQEELERNASATFPSVLASRARTADTLFKYEKMNPKQKKIGCARRNCTADFTEDILKHLEPADRKRLEGAQYSFNNICLIGPIGTSSGKSASGLSATTAANHSSKRINTALSAIVFFSIMTVF